MSTNHTIFLTVEGNIYGCGQGSTGQLGSKNKCLVVTPSLVFEGGEDNPVVDIVVGDGFSAFVTDKKVYCSLPGMTNNRQRGLDPYLWKIWTPAGGRRRNF